MFTVLDQHGNPVPATMQEAAEFIKADKTRVGAAKCVTSIGEVVISTIFLPMMIDMSAPFETMIFVDGQEVAVVRDVSMEAAKERFVKTVDAIEGLIGKGLLTDVKFLQGAVSPNDSLT